MTACSMLQVGCAGAEFKHADAGSPLTFRSAVRDDLPSIAEMAARCFPGRGSDGSGHESDGLPADHYEPSYRRVTPWGVTHIAVAENDKGSLVAYVYYQYRCNGDLYIMEIAAQPVRPCEKVPLAGMRLLRYALQRAQRNGYDNRVTLNVVGAYTRADEAESTSKLLAYYRRLGFVDKPGASGYTSNGTARHANDAWLEGQVANVVETLKGVD